MKILNLLAVVSFFGLAGLVIFGVELDRWFIVVMLLTLGIQRLFELVEDKNS